MSVLLGADDLQDAYHGCPNAANQLCFCAVAIMNPLSSMVEFYISYTHLFGLTAAVVNFNRLPELLTHGDSGGFDVTGWSGNTLRIEMDPGSPIFCLTE